MPSETPTQKTRRLAREARAKDRGTETEETKVVRAKEATRARAVKEVQDHTTSIPLMIGDVQVGKATVHESGLIVARIQGSVFGQALYSSLQIRRLAALQLAPTLFSEMRSTADG